MTLREQRCLFSYLLAKLILYANSLPGHEVAIHEVVRSKEQAQANAASGKGISNSLHLDGLAADLNLYINGVWQSDGVKHEPLGRYWKTLHPLCRWGGDFKPKADGNHYSMEWQGRK